MSTGASTLTPAGPDAWQVAAGAFVSNCYIHKTATGCVLVDPGLDPQAIDTRLFELGLKPLAVLCTHGHFDHVGGAAWFQDQYGIPVHLPAADVPTMKASNFLLMALRMPERIKLPQVTLIQAVSAVVQVDGCEYRYQALPGHTPGSSLICTGGYGFSGDSIYAKGVGLSKLPGEDHELLKAGIRQLWDSLPADMRICPGHGVTASWESIRLGNAALRNFLGLEHQATGA